MSGVLVRPMSMKGGEGRARKGGEGIRGKGKEGRKRGSEGRERKGLEGREREGGDRYLRNVLGKANHSTCSNRGGG